ncbi:hypothetical protein RV03_GL003358 [Enterococcus gallinarum]|nr:hypothetical protein RV03_GL003358 [Enterococcus gallinarum]
MDTLYVVHEVAVKDRKNRTFLFYSVNDPSLIDYSTNKIKKPLFSFTKPLSS